MNPQAQTRKPHECHCHPLGVRALWMRYAIKDDIPVMLIDESESLSVSEWKAIMERHSVKTDP